MPGRTHIGASVATIIGMLVLPLGIQGADQARAGDPQPPAEGTTPRAATDHVIRAISFRTSQAWAGAYPTPRAGRYLAVEPTMKMYTTLGAAIAPRDAANPLDVQFGVFANPGGFKLLGPNGMWVTLRLHDGLRTLASDGGKKADAIALRIVPAPRGSLSSSVVDELTHPPDGQDPEPIDGLVCLAAFDNSGKPLGLLRAEPTRVRLANAVPCGTSTSVLFYTDLPQGVPATQTVPSAAQDPLLAARFVPPERPRLPLTRAQAAQAANLVDTYLDKAYNDFTAIHSFASSQIDDVWKLLTLSGVYHGTEFDVTTQVLGGVSMVFGAMGAVPEIGPALKATGSVITLVQMGMSLSDKSDDTPRLIGSVQNNLLLSSVDAKQALLDEILRGQDRVTKLENRLLAGCRLDGRGCRSQRALAVWRAHPPQYPTVGRTKVVKNYVAGLERDAWLRMLPARGVLAVQGTYLGNYEKDECDAMIAEDRSPDDLTMWVDAQNLMASASPTDPAPLQTTPFVAAFHACYQLYSLDAPFGDYRWHNFYREANSLVRVALVNQSGGPTLLTNAAVNRMFLPYNAADPLHGGLGISRKQVACLLHNTSPNAWNDNEPARRTSWDTCDFHYTTATAQRWVSPRYSSPENIAMSNWGGDATTTRLRHKPGFFAVWLPDDPSRIVHDYDVVPAQEPLATWAGHNLAKLPKSSVAGAPTTVYFLNVTGLTGAGEDVTLRRVSTAGKPTGTPIVIPAGHPLRSLTDTYSPVAVTAHVGEAFVVTDATGKCLGSWVAAEARYVDDPATGDPVLQDYSVAEIHLVS